jgi:hypothetical protein
MAPSMARRVPARPADHREVRVLGRSARRTRGPRKLPPVAALGALVVAVLLGCQLRPLPVLVDEDGAAQGSCASTSRDGLVSLPPDLPEGMRPDLLGCDYERPERSMEQCREWVISLWEYHDENWDRCGRETLVRLCRAQCGACCETLADWLRRGIGGARAPKAEQRVRDEACRLGRSGQCSVKVTSELAKEQARRKGLQEECGSGVAQACFTLGGLRWVEDKSEDTVRLFDRACSLGMELGCVRASAARDALQGRGEP